MISRISNFASQFLRHGKPFSPWLFKFIFSRTPRFCIDLALVAETPKGEARGIVLTKRALPSWYGLWHLPGGSVMFGEAPEEAAHRVARDEVGADKIEIVDCLGHITFPSEREQRGFGWSISALYLATCKDYVPKLSPEASDVMLMSGSLPPRCEIIQEHRTALLNSRLRLEPHIGQLRDNPLYGISSM